MQKHLRVWVGAVMSAAIMLAGCDAATPTPAAQITNNVVVNANAPAATSDATQPPGSAPTLTVIPTDDGQTAAQNLQQAKEALTQRNFPLALAQAQAAANKDPAMPEAQFVLGNAYNQTAAMEADLNARQTQLNLAADAYLATLKLDTNNDAAHTNLGTVYYQTGEFDKAEAEAQAALKLKPNDARTHYLLGTILLQRDPKTQPELLTRAREQFELAIQNEANLGAAYIGLANVYLFQNDYSNALVQAKKGVDLMSSAPDPFALWALAQAQCNTGDKAGGTATVLQILSMGVPDPVFVQQVQSLAAQCK